MALNRFAFALTVLIAGCATTTSSWIGKPSSSLIREFGDPDQIKSDGAGGTIWIYEFVRADGTIYAHR